MLAITFFPSSNWQYTTNPTRNFGVTVKPQCFVYFTLLGVFDAWTMAFKMLL